MSGEPRYLSITRPWLMQPLSAAFERSLERSYLRLRVLTMLSSLGEAYARQLAKACGIDCWRLNQILFGDDGSYSTEFSLIGVGLADFENTPRGKVYRITGPGRRKARQLAARAARRDVFRATQRATRERWVATVPAPPVWPQVACEDSLPVATPVVEAPRWPVEQG